tara:strand:+ start:387 stop:935 length:549 start_codon:yes stop_codon:yes gene_type:complete
MPALKIGGKVKHFKYTPGGWEKFRAARRKRYISQTRSKIKKERQKAATQKANKSRFLATTRKTLKGKMSLVKAAKKESSSRELRVAAATRKLKALEKTGTKTEIKFAESRLKKFTNDFTQAKKKETKSLDQYNKDKFKASVKMNKNRPEFISPLTRKAKENFRFGRPNLKIGKTGASFFTMR